MRREIGKGITVIASNAFISRAMEHGLIVVEERGNSMVLKKPQSSYDDDLDWMLDSFQEVS